MKQQQLLAVHLNCQEEESLEVKIALSEVGRYLGVASEEESVFQHVHDAADTLTTAMSSHMEQVRAIQEKKAFFACDIFS